MPGETFEDMPRLEALRDYRRHAEWAFVPAIALELGVVDALVDGPKSAGGLAASLGLSSRGVDALLGALAELGAVRQEGDLYRLTGGGRAYLLDPTSPDFQRPSLLHWLAGIRRWSTALDDSVRSGEPHTGGSTGSGGPGPGDVGRFMEAMANKPGEVVERVVREVVRRAGSPRSLLDLGGGPGSFARAFAALGIRTTLYDRPDVIAHVRSAFALDEVTDLELAEGDFLERIPPGPFDVVLAANISHIYSAEANRLLFRRAADSVAPGGCIAILDFVRGRSEFAALFAITMLLATEAGGTYTLEEYGSWLGETGFTGIRCTAISNETHLVTAIKAKDTVK